MNIDIDRIDTESFDVVEHVIADESCYLITPKHIGCKWNKHNLNLRSVVVNSEGKVISASFPKFFNWGEQLELSPPPHRLDKCDVYEKLDGSTLIVSIYKGQLIVRTRGTVNARNMENGSEIDALVEKYPKVFSFPEDTSNYSLIFEWLSPTNRIVIRHEELQIKLIGCINHNNYELMSQLQLDTFAQALHVQRPEKYSFNTIEEMIDLVKLFKGKEGVCVYFNKGQSILKLKGLEYLSKHRLKDELHNFENVVDFYFAHDRPNYNEFYKAVEEAIDWETAEEIRGDISNICDGMKEVHEIVNAMKTFVAKVKSQSDSRRDQALAIQQAYGTTNRCSYAFLILDNKPLINEHYKKLLFQVTKTGRK